MTPTPPLDDWTPQRLKQRFGPFVSLVRQPPDELRLESVVKLNPPLLEGHACRYTIILPLLSENAEEVFSIDEHLLPLTFLLNHRFGGTTSFSTTPAPLLEGTYETEKEQNTSITVYSRRQRPAADNFFGYLKTILKDLGVQKEILVERADVWLLKAQLLPDPTDPAPLQTHPDSFS